MDERAAIIRKVAEIIEGYIEVHEALIFPGGGAAEHADYVNRVFGWTDETLGLTGERLTDAELARAREQAAGLVIVLRDILAAADAWGDLHATGALTVDDTAETVGAIQFIASEALASITRADPHRPAGGAQS